MINKSILSSTDHPNTSFIVKGADFILTPLRICVGADKKTHSVAMKIFCGLTSLVISPLVLIALGIKWLAPRSNEKTVPSNASTTKSLPKIDIKTSEIRPAPAPKEYAPFVEHMKNGVKTCKHCDNKLGTPGNGSWRKGHPEEKQQTFEDFAKDLGQANWPKKEPLNIHRLGRFKEDHLKIINITRDFLNAFHGIPVNIDANVQTLDQYKDKFFKIYEKDIEKAKQAGNEKEKKNTEDYLANLKVRFAKGVPNANGQYDTNKLLEMISAHNYNEEHEEEFTQNLGLTNEDLYHDGMNYVFGTARPGEGVLSSARFGDPSSSPKDFEKCLIRMMKISAHEFGHMRYLPHCSDYECNIGGYNSLTELDDRPLLFCMEDTAKICYMNQTSLLDYHVNLLKFFEGFNQKYKLKCDLNKEINTLKNRIFVLNTNRA